MLVPNFNECKCVMPVAALRCIAFLAVDSVTSRKEICLADGLFSKLRACYSRFVGSKHSAALPQLEGMNE